ncbi:hypothetical protein [Bradyrhizobium yuanmingense]|uniref:hypothetical protein n=1 Tax=Bradyrhizobium yuanmingense TaxID=108015 RepID=UPI0023B9C40E|nr:hypothetical protein [Bradyrhizobium yuanmingense]MDF0584925.1 hypothetical protein [Bradyrhizobium yuanmingense]
MRAGWSIDDLPFSWVIVRGDDDKRALVFTRSVAAVQAPIPKIVPAFELLMGITNPWWRAAFSANRPRHPLCAALSQLLTFFSEIKHGLAILTQIKGGCLTQMLAMKTTKLQVDHFTCRHYVFGGLGKSLSAVNYNFHAKESSQTEQDSGGVGR